MKHWRLICAGLMTSVLMTFAGAQSFGGYQGGAFRLGQHDLDKRTYNPGRSFLRWWDPLFQLSNTIDNWEAGALPTPPASWGAPADVQASFAFQSNLTTSPLPAAYRYATPVPAASVDEPWTPATGVPPTFSWQFNGLTAGSDYAISVNIPVGPTDRDPSAALDLVFQSTFQVYRIEGVENPVNPGQPIYQVVDTNVNVGGWVRLGDNGAATNVVYRVATGSTFIRVTLIGTVPRRSDGSYPDDPANVVVYADAARIQASTATAGNVTTQAVIGQNAGGLFPWRAVSGRSESLTIQEGSSVKSYAFPTITSYLVTGQNVIATDPVGRRNIAWSWPAMRAMDGTAAEQQRYADEKSDWLLGDGIFAGQPRRTDQVIHVDNTNGHVRVGATWTTETARPNFRGVDYLATTAVPNSVSNVVYAPPLPEGSYLIDVWIPGGAGAATAATYEVRRAGITIATDTIDQSAAAGSWVRIQVGQTVRWGNTSAAPLALVVTGSSNPASGEVLADQVRFTRVADVAVTSTPVYARANVRVGATTAERDVVIVALENGRIYCLDARGDESGTGVPTGRTQVYWTYPSETTGSDPNHVSGLDGPDGMAEMPTAFGSSSALVARVDVGGSNRDLLYVGAQNGRVYCIDMEGRGDGTTTRRWTYPNDYPAASVESALGPIVGSVAYAVTNAGPTVFVPTVQGRLYALDAAGDDATRTTAPRWTFPGLADNPVGSITMAPTVGWRTGSPTDRVVYFGTNNGSFLGNNTLFAVSADDGNTDSIGDLLWSRNGGSIPFTAFLNISPAFADQSDSNPNWGNLPPNQYGATMPNTLYVGNTNFEIAGFDADTGNLLWSSQELGASPSGPLGFTYARVRELNPPNVLLPNPEPLVIVPTTDGRYVSMYSANGRTTALGQRIFSTITLAGSGPVQPMAFGGPNTPAYNWMVGSDPAGYMYGWSWDPNLPDGGQGLTPGEPPIEPEPNEVEDPTSQILGQIAFGAQVDFILPGDFRNLQALAAAGNLTQADVTAATNRVTRRNFEFGETAYILVSNLPDPTFFNPAYPYTVDLIFNAPGVSSQRVQFGLSPVTGAPASSNRVVLANFSFLGIGQNALVPGTANITVRILSVTRPGANRTVPPPNFRPGNTIFLANPLAVSTVLNPAANQQVGTSLSPSDAENVVNGTPAAKIDDVTQQFRPELTGLADLVGHGQTGLTRLFVYDRSLMSLLFGRQRGLSSVRMELSNLQFLGTPFKTLDPAIYPNLEDLPGSPGNNVSLDYPDIRRDRMQVAKNQFGVVENPLFQAVTLTPPEITDANLDQYNTDPTTYNAFLVRNLQATLFDFDLNVPRFQPPSSNGYLNRQFVYVDAGAPGRQISNNQPIEPYREFGLSARIGLDERPTIGTPTVDLGSLPGGGGYLPTAPWLSTNYSMLDPRIHNQSRFPFFQRFSLFNEGNVNLLNLRVAKQIQDQSSGIVNPVVLLGTGLHPLAQLDGRLHLHSDLDPNFAARAFSARPNMGDRVILQKARPDDGEPTRLRINPRRRANPNLEVPEGELLAPADFPSNQEYEESTRDPKIAVTVPIGTPTGRYTQSVYGFEDRIPGTPFSAPYPSLDRLANRAYEPYTESPLSLIFNVRETRLTTNRTGKTMNMADNIPTDPAGRFAWSNQQPTAARSSQGTLVVAISSDRLLNGVPDVNPSAKSEADTSRTPQWRIYFFTLAGGSTVPVSANLPLDDLNFWRPNTDTGNPNNDKWFNPAVGAFPTAFVTPTALFGVPAGELDANSLQFTHPVFPAYGFHEPLSVFGNNGKADRGSMYLAFIGEGTRQTASGERRRETRLFLANTTLSGGGGGVSLGTPNALSVAGEVPDPQARIGKPALVQTGNRATVFYPITTGGSTQIYFSHFNGTEWVALPFGRRGNNEVVSRLNLGDAFESVSSPSATLRPNGSAALNGATTVDLVFTGRVRGRSQPEVYLVRIPADGNGRPLTNDGSPFTRAPNRSALFDPLTFDAGSGLYWSGGADWQRILSGGNSIDIRRLVVNNAVQTYESILVPGTARDAEGTSIISYDTVYGGKAIIDSANGSVRFSGALIPRNTRLFVRYSPRLLRLSVVPDVNHRAASIQFDDRSTGDNAYWFDRNRVPITAGFERSQRWIVTYGKTAARDSQASRPYMMTLRAGVRLPRPIQVNANGNITNLNFTFTDGSTFPYQVDPATGRIYFPPQAEGRLINITYAALDRDGTPLGNQTINGVPVQLIEEMAEEAIPIEQVSNESAITMALDTLGGRPGQDVLSKPGLIWMFWSSTRSGGTDVFFQTIAPRFSSQRSGN